MLIIPQHDHNNNIMKIWKHSWAIPCLLQHAQSTCFSLHYFSSLNLSILQLLIHFNIFIILIIISCAVTILTLNKSSTPKAFHGLLQLSEAREKHPTFCIPMVCVPATLSNNIPGSDLCIACDTALNAVCEVSFYTCFYFSSPWFLMRLWSLVNQTNQMICYLVIHNLVYGLLEMHYFCW